MELTLKGISKEAIQGAIELAQLYRYLNEPSETESICRDILAVDKHHQLAIRLLGLSLTEQFTGRATDRHRDAERVFRRLTDPYEQLYYLGLLHERQAKALLEAGKSTVMVAALLREALKRFEEAEKIRPAGNDESILRWNRCVRLIQSRPELEWSPTDDRNHR